MNVRNLDGIDENNSVGPKQATKSWKGHLGESEIRIGVTESLGFLAMAMSYELGGAR